MVGGKVDGQILFLAPGVRNRKFYLAPGMRNEKIYLAASFTFEKFYLTVKGLNLLLNVIGQCYWLSLQFNRVHVLTV